MLIESLINECKNKRITLVFSQDQYQNYHQPPTNKNLKMLSFFAVFNFSNGVDG